MKKYVPLFALLVLISISLIGCGEGNRGKTNTENVTAKEMSLDFSFGARIGTYTGPLKNELPNGEGTFKSKNEDNNSWIYTGNFVDGHFDGEGTTTWSNGQKQLGTYKNDKLNGTAKLFSENDVLLYEGIWKDGLYDGTGKLYSKDGQVIYDGEFINGVPNETTFKNQSIDIAYSDLARNPDIYEGKLVKFTGKVIQVSEGDNNYAKYRVAVNDDLNFIFLATYTRKDNESRVLEGDSIDTWGIFNGLISYTSIMGAKITIPDIDVNYLSIK